MSMGVNGLSDPGGRSWVTVSGDSFCQAYLGRGMLEDSLRCHYFARVKFSCVASSECSSTKFNNFLGMFPSSCDLQWRIFFEDHMVLGGGMPSSDV